MEREREYVCDCDYARKGGREGERDREREGIHVIERERKKEIKCDCVREWSMYERG